MSTTDLLDAHLNVYWLRPESALWDAIASALISQFPLHAPSLDLGSGNGVFSFITAGGRFSQDYDWFLNADPRGFWENRDIYDTFKQRVRPNWVTRMPSCHIDWALDEKKNLLRQATATGFYRHVANADANVRLPFRDESFQAVFSNILYWLDSFERTLREIHRVLRRTGRVLLCLPDPRFNDYCVSYQWKESNSEALRLLNRGRTESNLWTISYPELAKTATALGFEIAFHRYYLSPLTLRVWDIGLRPLSPVLIKMANAFENSERRSLKAEWIGIVRPFLLELFEMEQCSTEQGGFHFVCLEKI